MKYSILINQVGIEKAGLSDKTDLIDWAIIDYLKDWYFFKGKESMTIKHRENGDCVINYKKVYYKNLLEDLPIIRIKSDSELDKKICKLEKLNLIKIINKRKKYFYYFLTSKCLEILDFYSEFF